MRFCRGDPWVAPTIIPTQILDLHHWLYMQMRDELGSLYTNDMFADLYPKDGQPAVQPWRLALVTVMQFAENLTDRQAADAVRDRMAWK